MKTAISVPDAVYQEAEKMAHSLGWSRSRLYSTAVREFVERQSEDPVTIALNAIADDLAAEPVSSGRALIDARVWQW